MSKANRKTAQQPIDQEVKDLVQEKLLGMVGTPDVTNLVPENNDELPPPPDEVNIDVEGPIVIQPTTEELLKKHGNKSNAIRALAAEGKTRSETAKLLGIRYQHVNNVLNQVLKRVIKAERDGATQLASIEDRGPEGEEMSQAEIDAQ